MTTRPVDSSGDILPVRAAADLLSGPTAVAVALRDHLHLYAGDWWENPALGNEVLDLLSDARATPQTAETLSAYLTSYLLTFPAVRSISDVSASFSGNAFHFSCTANTEEESADIVY